MEVISGRFLFAVQHQRKCLPDSGIFISNNNDNKSCMCTFGQDFFCFFYDQGQAVSRYFVIDIVSNVWHNGRWVALHGVT